MPQGRAELHVHLEGSIEPETMCEIDPAITPEEVRERYRFHGFPGFLEAYIWVSRKLLEPAHYALAARRLFATLAAQNVTYAEVILSAGVVLWKRQDLDAVFQALDAEAVRAPLQIAWIFDAVRHFGAEPAWPVVEAAVKYKHRHVVAFGIGGDESRGPAEWFTEIFAFAQREGLLLTPHAGETAGPESVRQALAAGADRIGHGIRAAEDPSLLRELRDRNIPLEISIASNVRTGAVTSLEDHPVRRIFDAGVPITLNTDDPAMFSTSLEKEFELAAHLGFSDAELNQIAENGFRYAAQPPR